MKVKVVKRFRDKESKVINHPGDNLDVSEERFNELVAAGNYVEAVEDDEEPGADKEAVKAILDPVQDNNGVPGADKEPEEPAPETKNTTKKKAGRKPSAKN